MAVHRTVSGGAIQEGVLAFLDDKDSVRVLQDFAERNLLSIIGLMRGGIENAIKELSGRTSPSRLIVDVSRSKNVQRDVIHLADLCDTDTALVLIGSDEGIDLYRELISLGVRDYLLKPLSIESLYNAFDLRTGTSKGSRLVGVVGTSGGCGASTITAGLGWYLSEVSRRYTCVVDYDTHFASLALLYNRKPTLAIFDGLRHPDRVDRLFVERSMDKVNERLALLSGRLDEDAEGGRQAIRYRRLLRNIEPCFRYTLCEAPRWLDRACQALLEESNILVIVCAPDILSFRNAVELFKIATEEGKGHTRIIVVLNKHGAYRQGEIGSEQFEQLTGVRINHTVNFDPTVLQALNQGRIFVGTGSMLYRGIETLAADVIGERMQKQKGSFSRMKEKLLRA